jgi:hypothetical protein
MTVKKTLIALLLLFTLPCPNVALCWHDETHLAVAKAAGYNKWYNAVGADMAKIKAHLIESNNHYFNNNDNVEVTPEMVMGQAGRYNDPLDTEGHLYWAIIASLREYSETKEKGKYAEYHLAFCVHYVTDLSQPLHNTPYDDFNRMHHHVNDGIVDDGILKNIFKIKENMYPIHMNHENFEGDLAKEIARIANEARLLGFTLRKENRDMTKEEAYKQLGHSASLLMAILEHLGLLK